MRKKALVSIVLTIAIAVSVAIPCYADSFTTPAKSCSGLSGLVSFKLTGYLWYSDNSSTSITCNNMGAYIVNNGSTEIDDLIYYTQEPDQFAGNEYIDYFFEGADPGESVFHISRSWSQVADKTVYEKQGSMVMFQVTSGHTGVRGSVMIYANSDNTFSTI